MRSALVVMLLIPVFVAVPTVQASCDGQLDDTLCTVDDLQHNECQAINPYCQKARLQTIIGGFLDRTCDRQLGPDRCNL